MIHSERSESARIGEAILENINKGLCNNLNINQWKNTVFKIECSKEYSKVSADTRRITKQDLN